MSWINGDSSSIVNKSAIEIVCDNTLMTKEGMGISVERVKLCRAASGTERATMVTPEGEGVPNSDPRLRGKPRERESG